MIHNGHCFHCGHPMAVGSQECANVLCRVDERARPTLPWSRCAADETIALFCTPRWPWLLLPTLGILLIVFGTAIASGRLIDIGLVMVGGWFLSRYLLSLVRNANFNLYLHEQSRRDAQAQYDLGNIPDTPESRKKLDDEYDRVEHDQWAVSSYKWLKLTVNLATALLVTIFIMSWGPGDIFHLANIKNWGRDKMEKVVNSPIVADTKRELNWDNNRLKYLENVLRNERGITWGQFQRIVEYKHFSVDIVFDVLKNTDLLNDELYQHIYREMQITAAKPPSPVVQPVRGFDQKARERFQVVREIYWLIIFWTNLLLSILVAISFILMPISFAVAKGTMFADEIGDIVKQKMEEYEQRRREKAGQPAQPQPVVVKKEAPDEERKHGVVSIGIISLVTDLIFDKLLRKFFQ